MAEAGYPSVELETWFGFAAPAGVDKAIVQKLSEMFAAALKEPDIVKFFRDQGYRAAPNSPAEFADQIKHDIGRMATIIKDAGIATR
jgi:tripartite-type tricarboxylate transporter receptor subunit TctC